jgi:ubiquinone biosynthesis protein UbiJ
MNEDQKRAIIDFAVGPGSRKKPLDAALGFDVDTDPQAVFSLLEEAMRLGDGSSIECALMVAHGRTGDIDVVPTLIGLLRSTAHTRHEDLARWLQDLRDPRAVEALYAVALTKHEYLAYNNSYALARKCTWALADIGTESANEKLCLLAGCDDVEIAGYAQTRLARWSEEMGRKGRGVDG